MNYHKTYLSLIILALFTQETKAQLILPNGSYNLSVSQNSTVLVSSTSAGTISTAFGGASANGGNDPGLSTYVFNSGTSNENATSTINYYLEVYNPSVSSGVVPVNIAGELFANAFASSVAGVSSLTFNGHTYSASEVNPSTPQSATFDLSTVPSQSLTVNTPYLITLTSSVTVAGAFGPGSASIDPTFAIDPSFSNPGNAYRIDFSQGFGPTEVPEPSTWALLLVGLGLLGWRLRSRRPVPALVSAKI